jgi:hypothetical protein
MRIRIRVYMLMLGTAVVLIIVLLGSRPLSTPLTLELVGLTNIPPTVPALPLWTARDAQGEVSGLTAASPSHVLFKVSNRTGRSLPFRFMLYQFADSVPAGVAVPNGPSRHRAGTVHELPVELLVYKGMYFGPPVRDCFDSRTLAPRETALIALPRPPFDCVWRASVAYELPLTHPETLKYVIKRRLRIPEVHDVHGTPHHGAPQGLAYDEWIYGAWITNAVLNQTVQRTGASRSAQETNRPSPAAGSRR